jgi:Spy/CpxP family protein refolding chaperone
VKRAKGVAVLLLSLSFVIGGLSGMALEEAAGLDWFEFLDEESDDAGETELMTGMKLTPAQREKVDDILDRQEDQLEDYWEARMPEIRTVLAGTYGEIRALLDPAQQAQFDARVRELNGRIPIEFRD